MTILNKFVGFFEKYHRHGALMQLRAMPERQLRDCGISPELLELGVSAWPWRAPTDNAPMRPFDFSTHQRRMSELRVAQTESAEQHSAPQNETHKDAA